MGVLMDAARSLVARRDDSLGEPYSTLVAYGKRGSFVEASARFRVLMDETAGRVPGAKACASRFHVVESPDFDVLVYRPDRSGTLFAIQGEYLRRCLDEALPHDVAFAVVATAGGGIPPVVDAAVGNPDPDMPVVALGSAKCRYPGFSSEARCSVDVDARGGALGYAGSSVFFFGVGDTHGRAKANVATARREFRQAGALMPLRTDGVVVDPGEGIVADFDGVEADLPRPARFR